MPEPSFGERILERGDEVWTLREVAAQLVPGSRGPRCLICESSTVVRRLWEYPENWMTLTDDELMTLCGREPAAWARATSRSPRP
ncbi:MAG TPA: hypothetical protein VN706_10265 [Gemmatimonadaceae bacterium]|nr:hypothetical protein [Gemmatimonadaceae bacterium]